MPAVASPPVSPVGTRPTAAVRPVARVIVDVPLAHLDRLFDYLVPAEQDEIAVIGARVRVRFAGRLVNGWIRDRVEATAHEGHLAFLASVVSAEPVLSPGIAELAEAVAQRWAGSVSDVLRLAIPPRHARVEKEPLTPPGAGASSTAPLPSEPAPSESAPAPAAWSGSDGSAASGASGASGASASAAPAAWSSYDAGGQFFAALSDGRAPRAVWSAVPGGGWPDQLASAVAVAVAAGRGALVIVPDARDLARLDAAVTAVLGAGGHVSLSADLGPAERYRRWLAVSRGHVRVVLGTRSAAFAPVADLGLVAIWDDGDDLHAEPRAPYPHSRELLVLRAHLSGAAALIGGHAVSTEGAQLIAGGWARPLFPSRPALRAAAPRVLGLGEESGGGDPMARAGRLPTVAWRAARDALAAGFPVLVHVPRAGYQPGLACAECREPAR